MYRVYEVYGMFSQKMGHLSGRYTRCKGCIRCVGHFLKKWDTFLDGIQGVKGVKGVRDIFSDRELGKMGVKGVQGV